MNNLALLNLPDISELLNNPFNGLSQVLTEPFGVIGYIIILFALCAIVFSYTKNWEGVGIFIVLFGAAASVLFPIIIALMMLVLGIGVIFGSVFWKAMFKSRGGY